MSNTLFDPVLLGDQLLTSRIVMAPMTRNRADERDIPGPDAPVYYAQRASAGLIIGEAAPISPYGVGYPGTPGIYNDAQVAAWRRVTDAVHARGGRIYCQLWHVGRQSHSSLQPDGVLPVCPTALVVPDGLAFTRQGMREFEVPRELKTREIKQIVDAFADGARNAMRAGFDGVELHGANAYLIDQFLHDGINHRDDEYGGSVENRMRFLLEVLERCVAIWGSGRVGVRLSPSSTWRGAIDTDKAGLFKAVVKELALHDLGYLHLVEPEVEGSMTVDLRPDSIPTSHFRQFYPGTLIATGGYEFASGTAAVESGNADLIGFGRTFLANPDLPARFALKAELAEAKRETFYGGGLEGYIDYPSIEELEQFERLTAGIHDGRLSSARVMAALAGTDRLSLVSRGELYSSLVLEGTAEGSAAGETGSEL